MRNGNSLAARKHQKTLGFTLVELLVVMTILALLLSLALPRYFTSLERAKEATLKHELATLRDAIDKYYGDHGKYPEDIQQLIERGYINKYPIDPITDSETTWIIEPPVPPQEGQVFNIHSGAVGEAIDGSNFQEW